MFYTGNERATAYLFYTQALFRGHFATDQNLVSISSNRIPQRLKPDKVIAKALYIQLHVMNFKADFLAINLQTIDGLKTIPLHRDKEKFSLTGES